MARQPQISDAEWEVMKALWEHAPATVNELCGHLAAAEWHPKTIRTMLIRLAKKRAIDKKIDHGVYYYYPTVSREECSRAAADSFIKRVFDDALTPMVAHFVKRRALTPHEKQELRKLLSGK